MSEKKFDRLARTVFTKAKVKHGVTTLITRVGDPRVSDLARLRNRLIKAKFLQSDGHLAFHIDGKDISISCTTLLD